MTASTDRCVAVAAFAVVALACQGAVAAPRPIRADSPAEPSEAELATARALYRDAELLRRQDKLPEALARIEAAYRTVRTPIIALELARIDAQLGRFAAAYTVLRGIEEIPTSGRETDKGREARREAAAQAASLRERVAILRIVVPGTDAEVRVDAEATNGADDIAVDPGPHVVSLTLGDHACGNVTVAAREGEVHPIDLRDRAATCAPPPALRETEPASVEGDASTAPQPLSSLPANPSTGAPALDTSRWIALGLIGAGAVSVAAGGYFAVRAKADYDSVSSDCPDRVCTPYAYDVREGARARATGATYAMLLGLAGIGGGATLWILDPSRERRPADQGPRVGRVGVGVSPRGVWLSVPMP
jgi:hypothetical protein